MAATLWHEDFPACLETCVPAHEARPQGRRLVIYQAEVDALLFLVHAAHGLLSTTMMEEGMHSPGSTIDNLLFEP